MSAMLELWSRMRRRRRKSCKSLQRDSDLRRTVAVKINVLHLCALSSTNTCILADLMNCETNRRQRYRTFTRCCRLSICDFAPLTASEIGSLLNGADLYASLGPEVRGGNPGMTDLKVVIRDFASSRELRPAFVINRVRKRHGLQRGEIARNVDGCTVGLRQCQGVSRRTSPL